MNSDLSLDTKALLEIQRDIKNKILFANYIKRYSESYSRIYRKSTKNPKLSAKKIDGKLFIFTLVKVLIFNQKSKIIIYSLSLNNFSLLINCKIYSKCSTYIRSLGRTLQNTNFQAMLMKLLGQLLIVH